MDDKEKKLFTLMWSLLGQYRQLLGDALPQFQEVVVVLNDGRTPSPEQLQRWEQGYRAFDQKLLELTANLESLRPIVDPLFGYDA